MWTHSSSKWEALLNKIQNYFKENKTYYALKLCAHSHVESESYLLTLNNLIQFHIYMLDDVVYSWPVRLGKEFDLESCSLFKVFGTTIKLKNMFVCDDCSRNNRQIYVMQHFLPTGFFCICKSLDFIKTLKYT